MCVYIYVYVYFLFCDGYCSSDKKEKKTIPYVGYVLIIYYYNLVHWQMKYFKCSIIFIVYIILYTYPKKKHGNHFISLPKK
jgi:hypothetical protein